MAGISFRYGGQRQRLCVVSLLLCTPVVLVSTLYDAHHTAFFETAKDSRKGKASGGGNSSPHQFGSAFRRVIDSRSSHAEAQRPESPIRLGTDRLLPTSKPKGLAPSPFRENMSTVSRLNRAERYRLMLCSLQKPQLLQTSSTSKQKTVCEITQTTRKRSTGLCILSSQREQQTMFCSSKLTRHQVLFPF